MQKYEWVAGTGNDIVHTKAVDNFGVMVPGFGHDDLLCFPLAGADSNSEPLQAAIGMGAGGQKRFYMQQNEAAKRIFDAWLEPLRDMGARRNVIEAIGSTDHVPFDEIGVPAFNVIKDFQNYDVRTRHTNADLPDAVKPEDLRQSAVFMAVMTWQGRNAR